MNKIFLGLGILATSMAMVSCSQDDFDNTVNNPTDDGSRLYTQLTISLPTVGSRGGDDYNNGSNAGQEIGQDGENQINSLAIVLMDKQSESTYQFVASTSVTSVTSASSVKPTYQAIFSGTDIKKYYAKYPNLSEYKLWMFVVANPGNLTISDNFNPAESTFETSMFMSYDKTRAITMSGAPYEVTLPATDKELLQYDNANRPFNLTANGPVRVERSIARFDFKSTNDEIYEIKDNNKQVIGKIQLLDMAVVNERQSAYHFGRSSADGKNNNFKFELVNGATTNQYVVSPQADDLTTRGFYSKLSTTVTEATGINQTNGYVWTPIASLKDADNDESWNDGSKGDYKIWRYVNENTIPGTLDQKWGNSTGVIFRGTILDHKVAGDPASGIPGYGNGSIYLFQNKLYGNFENLLNAAKAADVDGNSTNPVLKHYFEATWGDVNSADEATITGTLPAKNGFTVYQNEGTTEAPKYYAYYYYWNRHEDNGLGNEMGQMEFAVVRNNVYKLAVNSINRFGHTTDPNDDPDPVDPNDPDEKENIFFKVDVTVLPWTVRINNIDF